MYSVKPEVIKTIDTLADQMYGLSPNILMHRACLSIYDKLSSKIPKNSRIAVLCGKGNNAGDGYGLCKLLLQNGFSATCVSVFSCEPNTKEAKEQVKELFENGYDAVYIASPNMLHMEHARICLENGITVPDTIAVLGTDNDEVLCDTATPSLSSISLDGHNAGFLCARLLARHMQSKRVEPFIDLAFPSVVTRNSTDANLIDDPFIARALTIVRRNLAACPSISRIAAELGVSERTLELKAKLALGTTLKAEIARIRLNEAVRMVSNSELPLREIAEKCGYCCTSHMGTAFRTTFGHPPSVFRYQEPG